MGTIKAIETEYAGCRFRSRLEARWAVFFDLVGVGWEYEPEGYELPSGNYLPDFRILSDSRPCFWIEIKPELYPWPSEPPRDKRWMEFAVMSGEWLYVLFGMARSIDHGHRSIAYGPGGEAVDLADFLWFNHRKTLEVHTFALKAARSARFEHGEKGYGR